MSTVMTGARNPRRLTLPMASSPPSSVAPLPLSPSLSAIKSSAVLSAAKRLVQVKENLSDFHKKGGFVGWLHGDEGDVEAPAAVRNDLDGVCGEQGDDGDAFALAYSPSNPKREALDPLAVVTSSLRPTNDAVDSIGGREEAEDDGLRTPPSPRSPDKSTVAQLTSMARRSGSGSTWMLESLYDKVVKASSTPSSTNTNPKTTSSPRASLQPSPRRKSTRVDAIASGFDDFVSAESTARRSKFFGDRATRPRAASDSPWRSPARRASSPSPLPLSQVGRAQSAPLDVQQDGDAGVLTLDDYLADPKLAAEFVNAALPQDSALLMLLYAIEELDALATLPTASDQAEATARTLLNHLQALHNQLNGCQQQGNALSVGSVGPRTLATLSQVALPTAEDAQALVRTAQLAGGGLALAPGASRLFRAVHSAVYAELDAVFTQQFTCSIDYARLMADRQAEMQAARQLDSALLLLDATLEDEWASTVLWAFLFREGRHNRLSFLMAVRFRLAPVANELAERQYRQVVSQLDAIAGKFLLRSAPVPLPTTSIDSSRLKAAAVTRITRLSVSSSAPDSDEARRARLSSAIDGLQALASAVRAELAASEKLATFSTSELFREFVTAPTAPKGDVVRLLRAARVSFHQAAKQTASPSDWLTEYASRRQISGEGDDALLYRVLAFERRHGEVESGRTTFVDLQRRGQQEGSLDDKEEHDSMLLRTVESFLVPELLPDASKLDDSASQRPLAFHFVAGAGDDALYGAVIRVPVRLPTTPDGREDHSEGGRVEIGTQGVCVMSRAPLVNSLRRYIRVLWDELSARTPSNDDRVVGLDASRAKEALAMAQAALEAFIDEHHAPTLAISDRDGVNDSSSPTSDVQLRELFDCLSIANVVRVFGCLLAEKKLALVSSSFSLLVTAAEALRSLLFPLNWAHVFAPVLPLSLRAYLQCPSPFLFGLHASYFRDCELPSDVVVVDLDRDIVSCSGATSLEVGLIGLRDTLLALCRSRVFSRDDIDCEALDDAVSRPFPERQVRLAFRQELEAMLATLEAAAFRFESRGGGGQAESVVVAVVDAPGGRERVGEVVRDPEKVVVAAVRQSQAFSAYVCQPQKV